MTTLDCIFEIVYPLHGIFGVHHKKYLSGRWEEYCMITLDYNIYTVYSDDGTAWYIWRAAYEISIQTIGRILHDKFGVQHR